MFGTFLLLTSLQVICLILSVQNTEVKGSITTFGPDSIPFTTFNGLWCRNIEEENFGYFQRYPKNIWAESSELLTLEEDCHYNCWFGGCETFSTVNRTNTETLTVELGCLVSYDGYHFTYNGTSEFVVTEEDGMNCYVKGSPLDCTQTTNCTPQLTACGGTLPISNFQKADLLSCVENATSFVFDSKVFLRKKYKKKDFFYNKVDRTFMDG